MPELIRSIVGRFRALLANRRRAPRFAVRLEAEVALSVSVPGAKKGSPGEERSLKLAGYTRDISADGLALIVPAIRIGGDYITDQHRLLEITLKLPGGVVRIYGKPVRYNQLDEDATDRGHLVGVQIERMSESDRIRFEGELRGWTGRHGDAVQIRE